MYQVHHSLIGRVAAFSAAWLFAASAMAQVAKSDNEKAPVYKPPVRGAPASRVGGGSRSVGTEMPRIYVLAPQDIGFTTREKPDLFWFASGVTPAKVLLTIFIDNAEKPLLEQPLPAVSTPGTQRVRLSAFNLELKPRVEYRWRITLIDDSSTRTTRALAGGAIQRVDTWPGLLTKLNGADNAERARIYAEEGLWYDAIELISDSIDATPANGISRSHRAGLLAQVGLTEASRHDAGQ